ncbi:PulJ/GspJ family protein [Paenibacillus silvisoli]|uniref:PulJ/GspJ family protein n=1 Tax=Paenibacillus silvisoli TaxID=3110539 RepID=UPI0028050EE9|nr:prepilin-type N-terminal cleavage/methylation domain-containing protein [Paenibacillus silvisoli]
MNRFVNLLRRRSTDRNAEGGYTLIELIASLTLLSVVMGVIYASITFGLNTYNKVRIENSLRDEGDLLMSSIITELYRVGPSRITQSDASGLNQSIRLTLPKIAEGDTGGTEDIEIRANDSAKSALYIGGHEIAIESEVVKNDSSITVSCSNKQTGCSSGMIEINLQLLQTYGGNNHTLKLQSRFGF